MSVKGSDLRQDHLSSYARAQHRNLLIAASVGLLFVILEPTKISALGVDIEGSERSWLLAILLATILYFEFAFLAASRADFHIWKRGLSQQRDYLRGLADETDFESAMTHSTRILLMARIPRRFSVGEPCLRSNRRVDEQRGITLSLWCDRLPCAGGLTSGLPPSTAPLSPESCCINSSASWREQESATIRCHRSCVSPACHPSLARGDCWR